MVGNFSTNSTRRLKTCVSRVPLKGEVVCKKHGVGFSLHIFLGAEFLKPKVSFGKTKLDRSCKIWSEAVLHTP
jgi:hypothetical protein